MQVREFPDRRIETVHDSVALGRFLVVLGGLLLLVLGYDLTFGTRGSERALGLVGSAFVAVCSGLLFHERSHFVFEPRTRRIQWSRLHGLRRRHGTLGFGEVDAVFADSAPDNQGVPSRRVVLRLSSGGTLPLQGGFSVDSDDEQLRLADRLRTLLETDAGTPTHEDAGDADQRELRALLAAGQELQAIHLLRERTGLDLIECKRRIDALRGPQRKDRR